MPPWPDRSLSTELFCSSTRLPSTQTFRSWTQHLLSSAPLHSDPLHSALLFFIHSEYIDTHFVAFDLSITLLSLQTRPFTLLSFQPCLFLNHVKCCLHHFNRLHHCSHHGQLIQFDQSPSSVYIKQLGLRHCLHSWQSDCQHHLCWTIQPMGPTFLRSC